MNMVNGTPEYAQWNYRISCHPLKHDLPLGALKPVDDMAARIGHRWNITRFAHTRAARFTLAVGESNFLLKVKPICSVNVMAVTFKWFA
jgi:hypothetical protein